MNIDLSTLSIVVLASTTLFFALGFVRGLIREKFNSIHDKIEQNTVELFAEQEKLWKRVVDLEKCCKANKCEKNYYNTGASSHL